MKLKNAILGTFGMAAVALATSAHAAGVVEFTSISGSGGSFIYTSGVNGGLALTSPFYASLDFPTAGTIVNDPALVSFTGLSNVGTTMTAPVGGSTFFVQNLSGGSFTIMNGAGTTTLLSGTFSGAQLSGAEGFTQAGVDTNIDSVTYTGGTYAADAGIILGPNASDKFNFSLIPTTPATGVTSSMVDGVAVSTLNSFTSAGNGQFTGVSAVPEPSTVASFGMGSFGLLGLMVRVRKGRRATGLAA